MSPRKPAGSATRKPHVCRPQDTYTLRDVHGISCGRVCHHCEADRRAGYRPEIFTDPGYERDEDLDE